MMSLVSSILIKPLPYERPGQLEMIWGYYPDANLGFPEQPTHGAVFSIIRDNTQAFESIAAFRGTSLNLGDTNNPERLDGVEVTGDFFHTLGVSPEIGRFLNLSELILPRRNVTENKHGAHETRAAIQAALATPIGQVCARELRKSRYARACDYPLPGGGLAALGGPNAPRASNEAGRVSAA